MKSTTFCRCGVTDRGAMEMSASPVARIGTLVSWLTGTMSSLTPRRLAYSFASTQAGPENCGPLPLVFSGSHGNSPIAAARSAPRFLIASMVGLLPGGGTSAGPAAAASVYPAIASAAPSAKSPRRQRCSMVGLPWTRRRGPRPLNATKIASSTTSLYTRLMSQLLTRTAPPPQPLDTESLASRIADRIVDAVAAGTLAPGQRLVEAEIAAALGVSRMPLREALKLLEAQGILSVTPRRGSFVVPFDEGRIGQICDARLALERLALRRAVPAFRPDPGLLAELDGLIGTMRQEAERRGWLWAHQGDLTLPRPIRAGAGARR